jgi:diacylglycerol O-acyltransferase / wax synthase
MPRLALLDAAFFAIETPSRPMHAGVLMLFDPPADEAGPHYAERVVETFLQTPPVAPFDRVPVFAATRLPHWATADSVDLERHVRRLVLPAPGSREQLMELVEEQYLALLDRSRPLWECYVIEGLASGQLAVFYKLHHALADGISGARKLFGSLSESADEQAISPLWGPQKTAPRPRRKAARPGPLDAFKLARRQAETVVGVSRRLAGVIPEAIGLRREGRALPFSAPRLASATQRQSPARSFAIFDLPLAAVKAVGEQAGGSVNDVVLSVCDDAMQRYLAEQGDPITRPLVASMAVSTRAAGDETPSNAAALAQVRLGAPDASPAQRLAQVVTSTTAAKADVRKMSAGALELESLAFTGAAQLREELPVGRGLVPQAANMLVSNIPGGPKEPLYMSGARLAGIYAAPIVPPAHAVNITLASYAGTLCFGIGAAESVIPNTARIAELALQCFDELARDTAPDTDPL